MTLKALVHLWRANLPRLPGSQPSVAIYDRLCYIAVMRKWLIYLLATSALGSATADLRLIERAKSGDAEAQVDLGLAYRDGKGVPEDTKKAVQWFRKSAQQGHPRGQDNYGFMLLRGYGIPQDKQAAVEWFEKCAAQGNHWGLNNLANCYDRGEGIKRDPRKAVELWKQAAHAGSDYACISLAARWLPGATETTDWERARFWLEKGEKISGRKSSSTLAYILWHGIAGAPNRPRARMIWSQSDPMALRYYEYYHERKNQPGRFANVPLEHLHQGYNLCGPTAVAMAAGSWGRQLHPYTIKRACSSKFGTGTDWAELCDVLEENGLSVRLQTWPDNDAGFAAGMKALRQDLDAGRVVVIDVIWPENEARLSGHTMVATGYDEDANTLIIHDPAEPHPGIRLMPYEEWKAIWHSRWYSKHSPGRARPVIRLLSSQ